MNDFLAARASISPAHPALIFREEQISYGELDARVSQVCGELSAHGVKAGQFVAAHLPNGPTLVALVHALVRLGAIIVPLNRRLTPPEISFQLQQAQADWLICGPDAPPEILQLLKKRTIQISVEFQNEPDPQWASRPLDLADPWGVIFTSGTTGQPKGAVLTYGNLFYSALASAYRLGTQPDDCWLLTMPLFHIGGLSILFRCCLYGTTVHLLENFVPDSVNSILDRGQVTMVSLVPTMLQRLMAARNWRPYPARLRLVLLGGAAAPVGLLGQCVEAGLPVASTYGLSEATSQVATATPAQTAAKPGTVGKPLMLSGLRIAINGEQPAGIGEIGEIWVSGPTVMQGYLEHAPIKKSGWLRTGDLGYLDPEGDLWVVQRRSDLIVTGGENVYPAEVEAALLAHPAVAAACVVGVPDQEWGQLVGAAVVLAAGHLEQDENELAAFLRESLAGYKCPRNWRLVSELPQTESGKVKRNEVAKWFAREPDDKNDSDPIN